MSLYETHTLLSAPQYPGHTHYLEDTATVVMVISAHTAHTGHSLSGRLHRYMATFSITSPGCTSTQSFIAYTQLSNYKPLFSQTC